MQRDDALYLMSMINEFNPDDYHNLQTNLKSWCNYSRINQAEGGKARITAGFSQEWLKELNKQLSYNPLLQNNEFVQKVKAENGQLYSYTTSVEDAYYIMNLIDNIGENN